MNSATVFAGTAECTMRIFGAVAASVIGTMMRTARDGYSACASSWHVQKQRTKLAHRTQHLPIALHRLRRHEHEGDGARLGAAVHPVVQRRLLHQHISCA